VSSEVLRRREGSGWKRAGRKIGFTNRTIWEQYSVYQPIFGYMYESTVREAAIEQGKGPVGTIELAPLAQPLIEPEIVFRLRSTPPVTDDPIALLQCIEWYGHGFEVVQCHFPGWKFQVADTIADGGLHGRYLVGPRVTVEAGKERALVDQLAGFRITLSRDGEVAAEGGGALVLDSPLNALAHLVKLLETLPGHPKLEAGELVTTGTLTTALPVAPGQTWSTHFDGLALPGLTVRFE
jgi:2-oxo-3-hexenedioate decarboxylase